MYNSIALAHVIVDALKQWLQQLVHIQLRGVNLLALRRHLSNQETRSNMTSTVCHAMLLGREVKLDVH